MKVVYVSPVYILNIHRNSTDEHYAHRSADLKRHGDFRKLLHFSLSCVCRIIIIIF